MGTRRKFGGSHEMNLRVRIQVEICHWNKQLWKEGCVGGGWLWKAAK
jgi:hypothetical protein